MPHSVEQEVSVNNVVSRSLRDVLMAGESRARQVATRAQFIAAVAWLVGLAVTIARLSHYLAFLAFLDAAGCLIVASAWLFALSRNLAQMMWGAWAQLSVSPEDAYTKEEIAGNADLRAKYENDVRDHRELMDNARYSNRKAGISNGAAVITSIIIVVSLRLNKVMPVSVDSILGFVSVTAALVAWATHTVVAASTRRAVEIHQRLPRK